MVDVASTTATVPLYEECFRCTSSLSDLGPGFIIGLVELRRAK